MTRDFLVTGSVPRFREVGYGLYHSWRQQDNSSFDIKSTEGKQQDSEGSKKKKGGSNR